MPELSTVETPKTAGFVNAKHNNRNRRRIEEQEKELEELLSTKEETEVETSEETPDTPTEVKEEETETLSREEKSFKKRYGDLRRHAAEKEKEYKERLEALEKRMATETIVPPSSDEDIAEWANNNPDIASIVETIAAKKAQEMFDKADSRLKELDAINVQASRKTAESQIREAHSDFDDLRDSDTFHDWVEEQPKWVQDALYENSEDARSVVRVIDLYKSDKGLTKEGKKAKTKAAASAVVKSSKTEIEADETKGTIKESDVKRMSAQEFEKREEEITKAIQSGKFIYDISGSAR
tara:strand:- start:3846 stop:4733 length:888 start_codon:yes stop_codon:yes gene_type:complete